MAQTALQNLQAALLLQTQALAAIELVIAAPTQSNVDAAIAAVNSNALSGRLGLNPTTSIDGESYDWNGMRNTLTQSIEKLQELIQRQEGAWLIRSRVRS